MFWEFARVLAEMGDRRPELVLLENVLGFASSNDGNDLRNAVAELNRLGYSCDVRGIDARHFVPQSRPRIFIVGVMRPSDDDAFPDAVAGPPWLAALAASAPELRLHRRRLPELPRGPETLSDIVEPFPRDHSDWWERERVSRFTDSLSPINQVRLAELRAGDEVDWRTAYRRTRHGRAVWEIRADGIAGCLRTARGGSSKQALVESGRGELRIRWLSPREYARLMGAPSFVLAERGSQTLFGFGDAVCVPLVRWLCEHYLALEARAAVPLAAVA